MPTLEYLWVYFTSPLPLIAVAVPTIVASGIGLSLRKKEMKPATRSRFLLLLLTFSMFVWTFLASSVIACSFVWEAYETSSALGVKVVLGSALIVAIGLSIPLSFAIRSFASSLVLGRLRIQPFTDHRVHGIFDNLKETMKLGGVSILETNLQEPVSLALDKPEQSVVVSKRLSSLLDEEELRAVLAHELSHIRNGDSTFKTVISTYTRILLVDPVMRFVEPAYHREREYLADETAAYCTQNPLALASALIKIHQALPSVTRGWFSALNIAGSSRGLFAKHPPLEKRVERLIRLSEKLMQNALGTKQSP